VLAPGCRVAVLRCESSSVFYSHHREAHPENYSTLHFAAHAIANRESPLDSAIVLAGPADNRKLYAREILRRPLSAELVTLSAGQSAGSRTYYGEGLAGFSWAFLSAGPATWLPAVRRR
jgi:CHAT domain-containing protein